MERTTKVKGSDCKSKDENWRILLLEHHIIFTGTKNSVIVYDASEGEFPSLRKAREIDQGGQGIEHDCMVTES